MKKTLYLILLSFITLQPAYSQMEITVRIPDKTYDTVRIFGYDNGKQVQKYAQPYKPEMIFQDKKSLYKGIYWIMNDSITLIDAFIISGPKDQRFSVTINDTNISYQNSRENTLYHDYMKELQTFDNQVELLEQDFLRAQSGSIPQYMMQVFVDSLMVKMSRISHAKQQYQLQTAEKCKGMFLSSVIRISPTIPEPTRDQIHSQEEYQNYMVEHFFDHFPWEESDAFNTMLAEIKDGKFEGGKIDNLGLVSENPEENYVQIPATTQFADGFTADDYAALVADMYAGNVTVPPTVAADEKSKPFASAMTVQVPLGMNIVLADP